MALEQTSVPDSKTANQHLLKDGTVHPEVSPFLRTSDQTTGGDTHFDSATALYSASYDGLTVGKTTPKLDKAVLTDGALNIPDLWNSASDPFNFANAQRLSFAPKGAGADLNFTSNKDLIPASTAAAARDNTRATATPTDDTRATTTAAATDNAAAEQNARELLASHKAGDRWQANGTSYYVDPKGDLVEKNAKGVDYFGSDGSRISVGSDGSATLSKGGDTVTKKGDVYTKTYADGQEVQLHTQGDDPGQTVKLKNMEVHQHKAPLQKLTAEQLQHISDHRGATTVDQGQKQMRVAGSDQNGNVVEKDSGTDGATVHIKNTQGGFTNYYVNGGKVYAEGSDGKPTGDAIADKDFPPGMVRTEKGSIEVGSIVLTADNQYHDHSNNVLMQNKTARVDGSEATVSSETNQETIKTADRTYNYDCNSGKFAVLNANGSIDLTYNAATQNLYTDGAVFTPTGINDNGCGFSYNGGFTDNGTQIYADDSGSSDPSYATSTQADVVDAVTDADSTDYVVANDPSAVSVADVDNAQDVVLAAEAKAKPGSAAASTLAFELGELQDAEYNATRGIAARDQLGSNYSPELVRLMVEGGASRESLQQQGLLPLDQNT